MNTAINYEDLPTAQREVADLYAWGMTKKEIANKRGKSVYTIENQIRRLFEKTEVRKDTEFTSWYFCSRFKISYDFSPLQRAVTSFCLLALISLSVAFESNPFYTCRTARGRSTRIESLRRSSRRDEIE